MKHLGSPLTARFRPTLVLPLLGLLSLTILILVTYSQYVRFQDQIVIRLTRDMYLASDAIDTFIIRNITIFKTIANLPEIVDQDPQKASRLFTHLNNAYPHIANAAAVRKDGTFFASGRPFDQTNPPSIAHVPFFQAIRDGAPLVIMDPHTGPISKQKVTGIALPIHDQAGRFNGLFGGSIYFTELEKSFSETESQLKSLVLVTDRNNTIQLITPSLKQHLGSLINLDASEPFPQDTHVHNFTLDNTHYIGRSTLLSDSNFLITAFDPKPGLYDFFINTWQSFLLTMLFLGLFCWTIMLLLRDYRLLKNLALQEEHLRTIYNAADSIAFITTDIHDSDPQILSFSRGAEIIFGHPASEITGSPLSVLVQGNTLESQATGKQPPNGQLHGSNHDMLFVRKDGEVFPALINTHPLFDSDGRLFSRLNVIVDLSAEKEREDQQKKLEDQLRQSQKMETIGNLAGGVAHDFNNILSAIIGYTEIALEELKESSKVHKHMREVLKASNRAKELVRQLLTFSRKHECNHTPLYVQDLVNEAMKLLRASIPSTIDITQNITPPHSMVLADSTQLHQIIMNLCTNAAHAIEGKQGSITVTLKEVQLLQEDTRQLDGIMPGPYVMLSVSDTGSGIPDQMKQRIFEPYFTTKKPGEGTGLGLAVVHGIVKDHRGAIRVVDNKPHGSRFEIYLPCTEKQEVQLDEETELPPGRNEHILLVDDEPTILETVGEILSRIGYRVTCQSDPIIALSIFEEHPDQFDLVISDQTMPGLSGQSLAEKIHQSRETFPIILCTGYSDIISDETLRQSGVYKLLMKPIPKNSLAKVVREALDAARSRK